MASSASDNQEQLAQLLKSAHRLSANMQQMAYSLGAFCQDIATVAHRGSITRSPLVQSPSSPVVTPGHGRKRSNSTPNSAAVDTSLAGGNQGSGPAAFPSPRKGARLTPLTNSPPSSTMTMTAAAGRMSTGGSSVRQALLFPSTSHDTSGLGVADRLPPLSSSAGPHPPSGDRHPGGAMDVNDIAIAMRSQTIREPLPALSSSSPSANSPLIAPVTIRSASDQGASSATPAGGALDSFSAAGWMRAQQFGRMATAPSSVPRPASQPDISSLDDGPSAGFGLAQQRYKDRRSQSVFAPSHRQSVSLEDFASHTAHDILVSSNNKVSLNVGGHVFVTSRNTLMRDRDTMLAALIGRFGNELDAAGNFFIDRDPTYFRHVLNFLRDGAVEVDGLPLTQLKAILREARYYQVRGLILVIEDMVKKASVKRKDEPSDEKVYKLVSNVETSKLDSVFQSMTTVEGYDFDSWMPGDKGTHLLFSKKLSRGELMLLERLQSES